MPKPRPKRRTPVPPRPSPFPPEPTEIPADLSKQAPNNSYCPPRVYRDKPFKCVDCGKKEVWTATQQKWWYEVAKGPVQSTAIRCRPCRAKLRA